MYLPQIFIVLYAVFLSKGVYSLVCYDCAGSATGDEPCTEGKNCTGRACLLYEGPDAVTTSAFCIHKLPKLLEQKTKLDRECWLEPDGKGKHCMCADDFCNQIRLRGDFLNNPQTLPVKNATLIGKNPLIDYDDLWEEEDGGMNAKPPPTNLLFPSAVDIDPRTAGESSKAADHEDEELVPIEHSNYEYDDERNKKEQQPKSTTVDKKTLHPHHYRRANIEETTENTNSGLKNLPPLFFLFCSSAAAIARLFS